jgi:hypothetical protein
MMGFQIVARSIDGLGLARQLLPQLREVFGMRYIVAWMLGVPFSVIVLWYIVGHSACG